MADTTGTFIPEIWSAVLLETMKREITKNMMPYRSPGTQLLRNAALGHDEMDPSAVLAAAIDEDILKELTTDDS